MNNLKWILIGYENNIPIYYNNERQILRVKFRDGLMGSEYLSILYYNKYDRCNRSGICNRAFDLLNEYLKEIKL